MAGRTGDKGYMGNVLVYTVGHSTRNLDSFIHLLLRYGIDKLADVRRFPKSRKFPHFNMESLERELPKSGVGYMWLGDLLGGFRKGGYKNYTRTAGFKAGVEKLIQLAKTGNTAIMCAEILWFRCHRRYISDKLTRMGLKVIHIVDAEKTYEHKKLRRKG